MTWNDYELIPALSPQNNQGLVEGRMGGISGCKMRMGWASGCRRSNRWDLWVYKVKWVAFLGIEGQIGGISRCSTLNGLDCWM